MCCIFVETPEVVSKLGSRLISKDTWNAWKKTGFIADLLCFGRKKVFKMTTLFIILVCEDTKQLLSRLYGAIFQFYVDPHYLATVSDQMLCINNKSGYFEHYPGMQVQSTYEKGKINFFCKCRCIYSFNRLITSNNCVKEFSVCTACVFTWPHVRCLFRPQLLLPLKSPTIKVFHCASLRSRILRVISART